MANLEGALEASGRSPGPLDRKQSFVAGVVFLRFYKETYGRGPGSPAGVTGPYGRHGWARAAALALGALAAAGCTKVGTAGAGPGSAAGAAHAWTQPGLLRIAGLSEPDSLNPLVGNQQIDNDLSMFWAGYLFNLDDHNEFVPELATEMPTLRNGDISRDGLTIVYHLRRGVLWQDGAAFTAGDVLFTYRAIMNDRNNIPSRAGYDVIASLAAPDPHTVVVRLKRPWSPFVATFFTMSGTPYPVLPKHLLEKYPDINRIPYNSKPVGTGPFIMDGWQRGQKIVFHANPHYWRGRPKLDRIEYDPIPDENTVLTRLQAHEVDMEFNAPSVQYPTLQKLAGYNVLLTPFTQFAQLALNVKSPVLSDVRVRRALAYATNVPEFITDITHGVQVPGDSDQPSFSWAHASGLPRYTFDPARARRLLEAAGWQAGPDGVRTKAGQRLTLVAANVSGSSVGNAAFVLAQRQWRDVGVDLEVKNYVSSLFFAAYGAGGILQRASSTWRSSRGSTAKTPTTRRSSCATRRRRPARTSTISATRRSMRPNGWRSAATTWRSASAPTTGSSAASSTRSPRSSCGSCAASTS